jgi:hypothetical protein
VGCKIESVKMVIEKSFSGNTREEIAKKLKDFLALFYFIF